MRGTTSLGALSLLLAWAVLGRKHAGLWKLLAFRHLGCLQETGGDPQVFFCGSPYRCKCILPLFLTTQGLPSPLAGPALGEVGEAMRELSEVKDSLDMEVKQNFIDPLQNLHDKDLREIQVPAASPGAVRRSNCRGAGTISFRKYFLSLLCMLSSLAT